MSSEIYSRNQIAMIYVEQKIIEFGQSSSLLKYKEAFQEIESVLKQIPLLLVELDTINVLIDVQDEVNEVLEKMITKERKRTISEHYRDKHDKVKNILAELTAYRDELIR
jgi:hypothetical protein